MEIESQSKKIGQMIFCSNNNNDKIETNLNAKFIIHDFEKSWNGQIITEEECEKSKDTMLGQPVLVKYFNEGDKEKDHLGTHEVYITKNRDTGEDMMATDTFAIGTFQQMSIEDVEFENETKRCLVGYAQLWLDRYYNVCSLLNEWLENGTQIFCSCEYVFKNYEMKDDVQYIKSPYSYTGHTILNSEEKDGYGIVLPAYDVAAMVSWNTALCADEEKHSKKCEVETVENIFQKSLNEISLGDARTGIYDALANVMTAAEFNYMWISDYSIYDSYFVYETYMDEEWKMFKVNYTKDENGISVDFDNKVQVTMETRMVEVKDEVESAVNEAKAEMQDKIDELSEKVAEQETAIEEKQTELNSLQEDNLSQKEAVISLNERIEELNGTITALSEYKEKYEAEKYEQALNEAKELYRAKFAKVKANDKFESEEVQALIVDTLDAEKALSAKSALADILLDAIVVEEVAQNTAKGVVELGASLNAFEPKQKKEIIRDIDTYDE